MALIVVRPRGQMWDFQYHLSVKLFQRVKWVGSFEALVATVAYDSALPAHNRECVGVDSLKAVVADGPHIVQGIPTDSSVNFPGEESCPSLNALFGKQSSKPACTCTSALPDFNRGWQIEIFEHCGTYSGLIFKSVSRYGVCSAKYSRAIWRSEFM